MTHDAERDELPSYEGEVAEESTRMRLRTKAAIGALAGLGISIATGYYQYAIGLICAYVAWMFIRTWLEKRRRDRTWRDCGGTVDRRVR